MDARELRINNLILLDGKVSRIVTISLGLDDESEPFIEAIPLGSDSIQTDLVRNIMPVPLTQDRLKKLGFEVILIDQLWRKNTFDVVISYIDGEKKFFVTGVNRIPELKYVHQLQNAYYVFNNEELTVMRN